MSHEATNWAAIQALGKKRGKWLWEKTGGHCAYCGRLFASPLEMTVDHVIPKSRGGSNDKSNRLPACQRCNIAKGARPLSALRSLLARQRDGQPHFTVEQMAYLDRCGIVLPEGPRYEFYWERLGNEFGPDHG